MATETKFSHTDGLPYFLCQWCSTCAFGAWSSAIIKGWSQLRHPHLEDLLMSKHKVAQLCSARFPVGVSERAVILNVVGIGANVTVTMGLS